MALVFTRQRKATQVSNLKAVSLVLRTLQCVVHMFTCTKGGHGRMHANETALKDTHAQKSPQMATCTRIPATRTIIIQSVHFAAGGVNNLTI
eukprot:scaffold144358_cov19-Tisochrysis_lutea.AAC.1